VLPSPRGPPPEHDFVDGQFCQLRKADNRLDDIGFDPKRTRKRRPWRAADGRTGR